MNESVIRTGGLTKRYGDILAVDDLSLEVPGGQVFGLLGPNGSGKTTTMGMLLGLVKQTAGSFSLFGSGTPHQNALHRVGAIVETPSFYPYLSGRDNLAYYQGITGRGNRKELDDLLSKVGLADRARNRFRTYSLRMKQRLGLAYALLGDPELLFLDEPTNGMDPAGMAEVREMIRGLGTGGRTVLLSSPSCTKWSRCPIASPSSPRVSSSPRARSPTWCTRERGSGCACVPPTTPRPSRCCRRWSGWGT